jgi:hypothetical protein
MSSCAVAQLLIGFTATSTPETSTRQSFGAPLFRSPSWTRAAFGGLAPRLRCSRRCWTSRRRLRRSRPSRWTRAYRRSLRWARSYRGGLRWARPYRRSLRWARPRSNRRARSNWWTRSEWRCHKIQRTPVARPMSRQFFESVRRNPLRDISCRRTQTSESADRILK